MQCGTCSVRLVAAYEGASGLLVSIMHLHKLHIWTECPSGQQLRVPTLLHHPTQFAATTLKVNGLEKLFLVNFADKLPCCGCSTVR